jgi:ketosteroid isomerase-like protein
MKYFLSSFLISMTIAVMQSCASKTEYSATRDMATIDSLMLAQQAAWNKADIPAFMEYYWKSDSLKFTGRRGITYGWNATLSNYQKSYSTPEDMGKLEFSNKVHESIDDKNALVIGQWTLFRVADTLGGYYTLHWKKIGEQWLIVSDHTS